MQYIHTMEHYSTLTRRDTIPWVCQNTYNEWKNPDKKEDILYDFIYTYIIDRKQIRRRGGGRRERLQKSMRKLLGMMDVFIMLIVVIISWLYEICQLLLNYICKTYLFYCMSNILYWKHKKKRKILNFIYYIFNSSRYCHWHYWNNIKFLGHQYGFLISTV